MKKTLGLLICLMFAGITNAMADPIRFTATSPTDGVLGYMDFDSSIFNGTNPQFIDNAFMLGIDFTNPTNGFRITTIGPSGSGTYFNSTLSLPSLLAGFGQQGGASAADEVVILALGFGNPSLLILGNGLGNNLFSGVGWSASLVAAVPEPGTLALLSLGLAGLAFTRPRKQ